MHRSIFGSRLCCNVSRLQSVTSHSARAQIWRYPNPRGGDCVGLSRRSHSTTSGLIEEVHTVDRKQDKLDLYLDRIARQLPLQSMVSVETTYRRFHDEAGTVISSVVPYEERPPSHKRADISPTLRPYGDSELEGDGVVLVVHAQLNAEKSRLAKVVVCSGFVVDATVTRPDQGDLVVTCAHTLLEMQRYLESQGRRSSSGPSFSFVLPSSGTPRTVTSLLSSMPRADAIVLEAHPTNTGANRLRSLPLTPFPVYSGMPVLTHLFGSPDSPKIQHSIARIKNAPSPPSSDVDQPVSILDGHAYRRWACGMMLGYRSYTGIEVEAGIHSSLPHILTSILPTPGSSGGPLINAETGTVVGMTSGRRMDNRVEGERGWGCSSEMLFEMFSLPGFTPTSATS